MKLNLQKRVKGTKAEIAKIRREGNIPAVIYVKGKESLPVTVKGEEFQSHLRHVKKGCLSTQIFDLEMEGKKTKAIIKDIQYHRVTYAVEHLDLMEIKSKERVSLFVPILCKGEAECPGVTQGGQVKKVRRSIKISTPVEEIPEAFTLDVSQLNIGEAVKVKDLPLSDTMRVNVSQNQTLVHVNK